MSLSDLDWSIGTLTKDANTAWGHGVSDEVESDVECGILDKNKRHTWFLVFWLAR